MDYFPHTKRENEISFQDKKQKKLAKEFDMYFFKDQIVNKLIMNTNISTDDTVNTLYDLCIYIYVSCGYWFFHQVIDRCEGSIKYIA